MTKEEILECINGCKTKKEAIIKLGWPTTDISYKKLRVLLQKYELEHLFKSRGKSQEKICPVCSTKFVVLYRDKTTCSKKCMLAFFRNYHFDETRLDNPDDVEKFKSLIAKHKSRAKIVFGMAWPDNEKGRQKFEEWCEALDIDISIFKYPYLKEEKNCPICNKKFVTIVNHPKEKTTCSYSCSNKYFHSGKRDKYKEKENFKYREICLRYFEPKCILCGWNKSINIHHLDENAGNNLPENLVPLCPNHHSLMHSTVEYYEETKQQIKDKLEELGPLVPLNKK